MINPDFWCWQMSGLCRFSGLGKPELETLSTPNQQQQSTDGTETQPENNTNKNLSLHFNGHVSGKPGLAGTRMSPFWILLELRMMEVVVAAGVLKRVKLQSNCHHQQTITHLFYRPDALPVTQLTVSEHWREKQEEEYSIKM